MVRTAGLLLFLRGIRRFTTTSYLEAVGACYVALWRLPRPDLHRLVIRSERLVRPLKAHHAVASRPSSRKEPAVPVRYAQQETSSGGTGTERRACWQVP